MDRNELKALHELATEMRDLAHKAYETALANRQAPGDTDAAYKTLLRANAVRDRIYREVLDRTVEQPEAPAQTQPTEELFRVHYTTSGLRRRVRTVNGETLAWMRGAWHTGIRVTSSRKATESEAKRGAFAGHLNS